MAKGKQTKSRRKNTQVGSQTVNFYNDGKVNVYVCQKSSVSPKSTYTFCTLNYPIEISRPIMLKDQLDDVHPILDMTSSKVLPEVKTMFRRRTTKENTYHKMMGLKTQITIGVIGLLVATIVLVKLNS